MKRIIYSLIILTLFASCGNKKTVEETHQTLQEEIVTLNDAQLKNASIAFGKLEEKNISSVLRVNGVIQVPPQNKVSISIPFGGYLKSTKLLTGMQVKKGEIIAVLEDQQYIELQRDYLTTKAQLVFAKQEFERQKELNESKASSDKVYQQALAEYTSLDIQLKSLAEKLKLIGINPSKINAGNISKSIGIPSPTDGFVAKVNVNIGVYVNPADVLFEIVDPSDIHLELTVFEKDLNKFFIGQKVVAFTNSNPDKNYDCEVILIGKDFSNDRGLEIHCHFDNYDKSLIPGMFMNAEIEVKSQRVYALPSDAVVSYGNKEYIFISKTNNQFEIREVSTGSVENGFTEILSPQHLQNQTIVIKGAYTLLMKMKNISDEH